MHSFLNFHHLFNSCFLLRVLRQFLTFLKPFIFFSCPHLSWSPQHLFCWETGSIQKEIPLLVIFMSMVEPVSLLIFFTVWFWQGSVPSPGFWIAFPPFWTSLLLHPPPSSTSSCLCLRINMLECFPSLKSWPLVPNAPLPFAAKLLRHSLSRCLHASPLLPLLFPPIAPSRHSAAQLSSDHQLSPCCQIQGYCFPYSSLAELASFHTSSSEYSSLHFCNPILFLILPYLPGCCLCSHSLAPLVLFNYEILEYRRIKTWAFFPIHMR